MKESKQKPQYELKFSSRCSMSPPTCEKSKVNTWNSPCRGVGWLPIQSLPNSSFIYSSVTSSHITISAPR